MSNETPTPAPESPSPEPAASAPAPSGSAPAGDVSQPVPASEQTYDIAFGDKTVKLTSKQIMSLHQQANQFQATAKEKAELEKGIATLLDQLDADPLEVAARRKKIDVNKYVTERFRKIIEEEARDPKEREIETLKRENDEWKKGQEEARQAEIAKKREAEKKVLYSKTLSELDAAMTAKGLPKDKITVDRMLRIMAAGKKARGTAFSAADAAEIVYQEEVEHTGFIAKALPSEQLKAMFGPDIIKRLNEEQISALKDADKQVRKENKATEKETSPSSKKAEGMTEREYRRKHGGTAGL